LKGMFVSRSVKVLFTAIVNYNIHDYMEVGYDL